MVRAATAREHIAAGGRTRNRDSYAAQPLTRGLVGTTGAALRTDARPIGLGRHTLGHRARRLQQRGGESVVLIGIPVRQTPSGALW